MADYDGEGEGWGKGFSAMCCSPVRFPRAVSVPEVLGVPGWPSRTPMPSISRHNPRQHDWAAGDGQVWVSPLPNCSWHAVADDNGGDKEEVVLAMPCSLVRLSVAVPTLGRVWGYLGMWAPAHLMGGWPWVQPTWWSQPAQAACVPSHQKMKVCSVYSQTNLSHLRKPT